MRRSVLNRCSHQAINNCGPTTYLCAPRNMNSPIPPIPQGEPEPVEQLEADYRPLNERYDHDAWLDSAGNVHAVWLLRGDVMTIEVCNLGSNG